MEFSKSGFNTRRSVATFPNAGTRKKGLLKSNLGERKESPISSTKLTLDCFSLGCWKGGVLGVLIETLGWIWVASITLMLELSQQTECRWIICKQHRPSFQSRLCDCSKRKTQYRWYFRLVVHQVWEPTRRVLASEIHELVQGFDIGAAIFVMVQAFLAWRHPHFCAHFRSLKWLIRLGRVDCHKRCWWDKTHVIHEHQTISRTCVQPLRWFYETHVKSANTSIQWPTARGVIQRRSERLHRPQTLEKELSIFSAVWEMLSLKVG